MPVHEKMLPQKVTEEDRALLMEILKDVNFKNTVTREIGSPVKVSILEDKNLVKFKSPNKVKTVWIDVLLAYSRGEVH